MELVERPRQAFPVETILRMFSLTLNKLHHFFFKENNRGYNPGRRYLPRWRRIIAVVVIILAPIGLGVGLRFGLSKKSDREMQTSGAKRGSGTVVIDLELVLGDKSNGTGYFQRYDGVIELSKYSQNAWKNGPNSQDLDTRSISISGQNLTARDGTPLMALTYAKASEQIWEIIYVTADNYLANWRNSNITQEWTQGTLRGGDFKVSTSNHTGLSACTNAKWFGEPFDPSGFGIRLYYGDQNDNIQELTFNLGGQTTWSKGASFPEGNGAGGFECTVRGKRNQNISTIYLWMQNKKGELQQMWFDFDETAGTNSHKVRSWQTGFRYSKILKESAITAISEITSNPPKRHIMFQAPDYSITRLVSTGSAENSTWGNQSTVGYEHGIPGTRIGSAILKTGIEGAQELHVVFQTNETNMVDYINPFSTVDWVRKEVPVGL